MHVSLLIPALEREIKACRFPAQELQSECEPPHNLQLMLGLLPTLTFFGQFLGALMWGWMSDKYGRQRVFLLSVLFTGLIGITGSLAPNLASIFAWRFLLGLAMGGSLSIDFVMFLENLGPKYRNHHSSLIILFGIFGVLYTGFAGWLSLERWGWRIFIILVSVPNILSTVLRMFWKYESPRFLLAHGRVDEAKQVVIRMADMNRIDLPDEFELKEVQIAQSTNVSRISGKLIWTIARFTIIWFSITFGYYGITYWLGRYLESKGIPPIGLYENFMLISVSELPGLALTTFLLTRLSKPRTLIFNLIGCAAGSLAFNWSTHTSSTVLLCLIYFFIVGAWTTLYIYTPESFPTRIRNRAFAVTNLGATVAGMLVGPLGGWLWDQGVSTVVVLMIFTGGFLLGAVMTAVGSVATDESPNAADVDEETAHLLSMESDDSSYETASEEPSTEGHILF